MSKSMSGTARLPSRVRYLFRRQLSSFWGLTEWLLKAVQFHTLTLACGHTHIHLHKCNVRELPFMSNVILKKKCALAHLMELVLIQHYISYVPNCIHFKASYSSYFFPDFFLITPMRLERWLSGYCCPEDPSWISRSHTGKLTGTCNSSSRGIWCLWPLHAPAVACTDPHTSTKLKIKNIKMYFKARQQWRAHF